MAIQIMFLSVIIPIDNIERCHKIGGLRGIIKAKQKHVGRRVLIDDYLYRDGAMGSMEIENIVKFWEGQGLEPIGKTNEGKEYWKDLCVVDQFCGPTLPCDWIEVDHKTNWPNAIVGLKGKDMGDIVKPTYTI